MRTLLGWGLPVLIAAAFVLLFLFLSTLPGATDGGGSSVCGPGVYRDADGSEC